MKYVLMLHFSIATLSGALFCTCGRNPGADGPAEATAVATVDSLSAHDRALFVKEGWIRDPYIYLDEDGYYYLTGTTSQYGDPRNETEPHNTGLDKSNQEIFGRPSIVGYSINVWRSTDLTAWEYVGAPFTLDQGYWAERDPAVFADSPREDWRLWAPELYRIDGKWVFVHTTPAPYRRGSNLAVSTGEGMNGPFTFPMGDDMEGRHDPSLFRDDDGTWYLLWGNTLIAPIESGFSGLAAAPRRIDPSDRRIGHEGATLRKIGTKYVHFGTAWSTDSMRQGSYNLYYSLADHPLGPYGPRRFVGRFLGHGTPFQDKVGRWWCTAFYNGNVPTLPREGITDRDLGETAQTINRQGTTLVPLQVDIADDGDVFIRAKDPAYRNPGPDEAQEFTRR